MPEWNEFPEQRPKTGQWCLIRVQECSDLIRVIFVPYSLGGIDMFERWENGKLIAYEAAEVKLWLPWTN